MTFTPEYTRDDVTPQRFFLNRRQLIAGSAALMAAPAFAGTSPYSTDEPPNSLEDITTYNNYYEFGYDKTDPAEYASALTIDPWSVTVDGLVDNPGKYSLADLIAGQPIEERIYRFRCVEAWSMVVPWQGFQLSGLLQKLGVKPEAKYVAFETVVRPSEMRGQNGGSIEWPYREGLRIDEAMNPLAFMATGLYGQPLPKQSGAPIRLVVPWKYGFKSAKALVRISLTDQEPVTTWKTLAPNEYGFYANVNPEVDHPRWSQATERRIGGGLFAGRIDTQMFNGYGDQVASLYSGQDLAKDY